MLVNFPGFPTEISDPIEFPDEQAMLREPILYFAPAEWVMRNGSEFQKHVLMTAPLKHKSRYILMSTQVRVVYPGILINKVETPFSTRNEWHADVLTNENAKIHALCNSLGTEFNTQPFTIDLPKESGYLWFCEQSAKYGDEWGLTPKDSPTHRIVSFENHVHRAQIPTKVELRYFIRINEIDHMHNQTGQYRRDTSYVYEGNKSIKNIVQHPDGTVTVIAPGY